MNYGRKTPSTYRSNHSVYSGQTGRSTSNLHSAKSKSLKSVLIPWYQKPMIHNNEYIDIQKTALITGFFTLVCILLLRVFHKECFTKNFNFIDIQSNMFGTLPIKTSELF